MGSGDVKAWKRSGREAGDVTQVFFLSFSFYSRFSHFNGLDVLIDELLPIAHRSSMRKKHLNNTRDHRNHGERAWE